MNHNTLIIITNLAVKYDNTKLRFFVFCVNFTKYPQIRKPMFFKKMFKSYCNFS